MNLPVFMNMHEPWTVEPWHIRVNFRLNGIQIMDDDCVELPNKPSGPNLDLEGKDFVAYVTVSRCSPRPGRIHCGYATAFILLQINKSEKFPVRCRLRHFTKIYHQRIMLGPDHMCVSSEPIYPEQKEILDKIPLPKPPEDDKV